MLITLILSLKTVSWDFYCTSIQDAIIGTIYFGCSKYFESRKAAQNFTKNFMDLVRILKKKKFRHIFKERQNRLCRIRADVEWVDDVISLNKELEATPIITDVPMEDPVFE